MILQRLKFRMRDILREKSVISYPAYMMPNCWCAVKNIWKKAPLADKRIAGHGVAICLRFRDEARFLAEWIDYYLAAGVEHFFMYNNFSADNYEEVLRPYIVRGVVTLIDWPRRPASPYAENDCIERARHRFRWVGFLDADEFVVIRDGSSIPSFLEAYADAPGLALHWRTYGSSGHNKRPAEGVIQAYTRRAIEPDHHFKVFVRPEMVTENRNSHNFYYKYARRAVDEKKRRVYGSVDHLATAELAWINHYYCKSREDYLEKSARKSTLDRFGLNRSTRGVEWIEYAMQNSNDMEDLCALEYFQRRQHEVLRQTAPVQIRRH